MVICKRCGEPTIETSISRRDKLSKICVGCSVKEVRFDYGVIKATESGYTFGQEIFELERSWIK